MGMQVQVQVKQIGPSASEGTAREHTAIMDRPAAKGGENRGAMGGRTPFDGTGRVFYEQPAGGHPKPGSSGVRREFDHRRHPRKCTTAFFSN